MIDADELCIRAEKIDLFFLYSMKKVEIGMLCSALESPDGLFPPPPPPTPFFSLFFSFFFSSDSIPLFFLGLCGVCLVFLLFFLLLAGGSSLSYCCLFCALLLSFFLFFFLCLLFSIFCFMEMILDYCWTRTTWNLWATSISKYRKQPVTSFLRVAIFVCFPALLLTWNLWTTSVSKYCQYCVTSFQRVAI